MAYGEFRVSHVATCPDVSPDCGRIEIPPHEHHVRLGLYHGDLSVAYGLTEKHVLSLQLPYDVKDMRVGYRTLEGEPYDPPYGDIHHRTQRLQGVSDGEVTIGFSPGRDWLVSAGLTLPLGRTEPDPIELGRRGETHQHTQFGSGTVDPTLGVQWSRPLGRVQLSASADARFPLYENRHGFRPPVTVRWTLGPSLPVRSSAVAVQFAGQYQAIARWSGQKDEGTGFHNGGLFLRGSFLLGQGLRISPGIYREVYTQSLSEESFRQGTTYSITLTRFLP